MQPTQLPPAQLWLGNHELLIDHVVTYVQEQLCTQKNCGLCIICTQIRQQQYHAVVWICPEKSYTLSSLEIIHNRLSFALPDDQHCFFIIQKADTLTTQCANSLLKSIEEPPRGYHFILTAQRSEDMLPTIASRCVTRSFLHEQADQSFHSILQYFNANAPVDPVAFDKELQKNPISERQSAELIDSLLMQWIYKYNKAMADRQDTTSIQQQVHVFQAALKKPPMPGSSKLFWRNLFLQFHAP